MLSPGPYEAACWLVCGGPRGSCVAIVSAQSREGRHWTTPASGRSVVRTTTGMLCCSYLELHVSFPVPLKRMTVPCRSFFVQRAERSVTSLRGFIRAVRSSRVSEFVITGVFNRPPSVVAARAVASCVVSITRHQHHMDLVGHLDAPSTGLRASTLSFLEQGRTSLRMTERYLWQSASSQVRHTPRRMGYNIPYGSKSKRTRPYEFRQDPDTRFSRGQRRRYSFSVPGRPKRFHQHPATCWCSRV